MSEELKIIIKAITDEAQKNLEEIKKELKNIDKESNKAGKSMGSTMAAIAKGVAAAVAAVVALTAAMSKLAQSAQNVEKGFAKLRTTFINNNSTASQATATYKELFSFLGDHDKAVETAQSLALITNEEEKLTEWTNTLMGAFAEMGDKLPIEGLAEAANETINTGAVTGVLADALTWAGISEDGFNEALAQTVSLSEREALVRNTLNGLYGGSAALYAANNKQTIEYQKAQADLNIALSQTAAYTTPLLTALANLGTTILTYLAPAIRTIFIYLTAFIQLLAEATAWVGGFFGVVGGGASSSAANVSGYQKAMQNYTNSLKEYFGASTDGADENINKIKELKKQTMGFDELNVVSNPATSSASGGASGGGIPGGVLPVAPNAADFGIGSFDFDLSKMKTELEEAKEKIQSILTLAGLTAAAIAAWKIAEFVKALQTTPGLLDTFKGKLQTIGGLMLAIVGYMLLIQGYSDAWANGVDWGNMAIAIGGLSAVIGGVAIAYGALAASIAAVAGGAALMILGVKDFIDQGPTIENTILIIGGAIAVAVGLATAGLSVLVAAIVAAVAAVAAFTAAIILEKPAIMSVEEAQEALTAAKERAAAAENGYINAIDAAEAAQKRLAEAEKAAGITGEELYKQVQAGTLDYADMTAEQRECYKAYLDNEKKQADLKKATEELSAAKKAETIASYENQLAIAKESGNYDEFKKSVIAAYEEGTLSAEEARDLIAKSMSEMSDDAQQTFMEDIPGDIKDGLNPHQYESTGTKISKWFKNTGNTIGTWFSDSIWKPIKDWWNNKVKPIFTKEWWTNKFNTIKEGAKAALNGAITVVENALNFIIRKINTLSWDIPDWVPLIGGSTFGFNFREIRIPRLAEGGIVNSSILANIGENGREAVLPLENNTGWMDALADRIAARNNTPSKIVLQVGEKELGWATIDAINGITRQTGGLQLAL